MFYLSIINNIALLVTLSIVHNQIVNRLKHGRWTYPILSGLLFGGVGIIGMMNPVNFMPGVIFDGRSIILCVAGLFGGPVTAAIGGAMCIAYRVWLGGSGALMGVSVITASAALGVAYHFFRKLHPAAIRPLHLYAFGFLVHLAMVALMALLPGAAQAEAYRQIALPVLVVYPVATLVVCLLFLDQESRLRSEAELRTSEESYRIVADFSYDWEYWLRPDLSFQYVSPSCERITGYSAAEFVSEPSLFTRIVHPEDRVSFEEHVNACHCENSAKADLVYRIVTRGGETRWLAHCCLPVHTADGVYLGRRGSNRDITDARHAEMALKDTELLYQSLVENLPQGVFRKDREGRYTFVNSVYCREAGLTAEEILGQDSLRIFPFEQARKYQEDDRRIIDTGEPTRREEQHQPPTGPRQYLDVVKVPLRDANGTIIGIQGLCSNVTERKHLEEQLRQAQKMEAVGQLAGGVAHDFNNLLQVILVNSELAQSSLTAGAPAWEEIGEVQRAAERAADLTRQLLAFGRRQVIRPVNLDLNDLIQGTLKMLRRIIGEHIDVSFVPGWQVNTVCVDRGQVEQVLMNLCLNARDSMPEGGRLTIETRNVTLDAKFAQDNLWAAAGQYVLMSVVDTGHGMDADTCAHIFEPFFTTKGVGEGTGLGLATVYGIVKQHNGLIQVRSEPHKGTVFMLYLPAVEAPTVAEPPLPTTERRLRDLGGTETILVAEDEKVVLDMVSSILRKAGYTVLTACDGHDALRVFEAHAREIDLAVLDVMMPGLNGRHVMDRIQSMRDDLPFLFSSGYSENALYTDFVLEEGLRLIQKPYRAEELLREVRQILDLGASSRTQ